MFSPVNWGASTDGKNNEIPERPYSGVGIPSADRNLLNNNNNNNGIMNNQQPTMPSAQLHPAYRDLYSPPTVSYPYQGGHVPINSEVRHAREVFLTDLKSQLRSTADQLEISRKEAHENGQKAMELEKSISSFWNPELKKERLARKEENVKFLALKDQHNKVLDQNAQLQAAIQTLSNENTALRTQLSIATLRSGTGSSGSASKNSQLDNPALANLNDTFQIETLKGENDQKSKEIYLLKKTLEEMELRIETQKQTLTAKDQSIQKLLEMLQAKGFLQGDSSGTNSNSTNPVQMNGELNHVGNLEIAIHDLKSQVNQKDQEISKLKTQMMTQSSIDLETRLKSPPPYGLSSQEPTAQAIKQLLESKDEKIGILEKQLQSSSNNPVGTTMDTARSLSSADTFKEHIDFLKSKLDQVRIESSKKESELVASQSKSEILMKQCSDQSQHINVLKEALFTKEQQILSLQSESDNLKARIDEREMLLQKKKNISTPFRQSSFSEYTGSSDLKDKQIHEMRATIDELKNQVDSLKLSTGPKLSDGAISHNELQSVFGDRERMIQQMRLDKEKQKNAYDNQLDSSEDNQIKSRIVREHEEKVSSLLTANMKKDSAIKTLEINLAQKTEEVGEWEGRVRRLQEEKVQLIKDKQELRKQVDALEEQVNHYIDELTRTQSMLDKTSETMKELDDEKKVHQRRVNELEGVTSQLKVKLNEMRRVKSDENVMQQKLLHDARKREGDVIHDAAELQEVLMEKDKRIVELEQALEESARMTVAREAVLSKHNNVTTAAHRKVDDLVVEVERLQKALKVSDSKLSQVAGQLSENEAKMQHMQADRRRQLADAMQMKHDALAAALGEKNAHIALLENSAAQAPAAARDLKKLHAEKEQLVRKLNEQNEKRMTLLQNLNSKVRPGKPPGPPHPTSAGGSRAGSRQPSVIEEEPEGVEGAEENGVWA